MLVVGENNQHCDQVSTVDEEHDGSSGKELHAEYRNGGHVRVGRVKGEVDDHKGDATVLDRRLLGDRHNLGSPLLHPLGRHRHRWRSSQAEVDPLPSH